MRKIINKFSRNKLRSRTIFLKKIHSLEEGAAIIKKSLETNNPIMIGRIGSVEMQAINAVINFKEGLIKSIPSTHCAVLCNNAGFFPNDTESIIRFANIYIDSAKELDIAAVFIDHDEDYFYHTFSNAKTHITLSALEPYYSKNAWSKILEGKKVLIVHPFSNTIQSQYKKRDLLFENKDILPSFELQTLKAVQTIGGNTGGFNTWFEALDYMKAEMEKKDFDIVILGCGAYAFPLAAHAKTLGKKAIVLGGATQILFGIKGKRWDNHPKISKLYNEHWSRPSSDEIPKDNEKVENGCYW